MAEHPDSNVENDILGNKKAQEYRPIIDQRINNENYDSRAGKVENKVEPAGRQNLVYGVARKLRNRDRNRRAERDEQR